MNQFPLTSLTLIQKLAEPSEEVSEAAWVRFFGLYTPVIRRLAHWYAAGQDPDDVVQEIYVKLVDILGGGKYRPDKARFHTFLVLLVRRHLVSLYRKDSVRGADVNVPLDDLEAEPAIPADQAERIDADWARAKHEAAVNHVLTQMPLSAQTRDIYRAYALEERPAEEIAAEFGLAKSVVYKTKNRVDRMVAVIEAEYGEEG